MPGRLAIRTGRPCPVNTAWPSGSPVSFSRRGVGVRPKLSTASGPGGSPMAETRAAEVREAVRAIRALHALGRRLPPKAAPRDAYGQAVVARAAEARGTN